MKNKKKYRIRHTDTKAAFTQRGKVADRGFIRVQGRTISGALGRICTGEQLFWPNDYTTLKQLGVVRDYALSAGYVE